MTASKTTMRYGDPNAMIQQAAGLFALCQGRNSTLNRLTGKMPSGTNDAEKKTKGQSSLELPIVQAQDLGRNKGDEVRFHFVQPANAFPIMGSEYAEGKGTGLKIGSDQLRVNQARFPVDLGDVMSQIRNPYDLRRLGRPKAKWFMDAYLDQSMLVHLAGARGNHYNKEWCLPLETHPKLADMLVNRVKAPTKNRHFVASADAITGVAPNAGEYNITTADVLDVDVVDSIATYMDQIELPPPPVKFEGDEAAEDSPIRVLLCSPAQYNSFAKQEKFRSWQAAALARASNAKQHPIFRVDAACGPTPSSSRCRSRSASTRATPSSIAPHTTRKPSRAPWCRIASAISTRWTAPCCWAARLWRKPGRLPSTPACRSSGPRRTWTTATSWNC